MITAIPTGLLALRARLHNRQTLAEINRFGRGEEELCWPWSLARYRGVPIPQWFPHEIRFADDGDGFHSREFLQAAGKCHTLEYLGLSSSSLQDDDFAPLGQLTALRWIELSYPEQFSGMGFRHLPAHNSVEKIVTESTGITDEGVAQLARFPRLRELQLDRCQVTDDGLAKLARLPNLKRLALNAPQVTATGILVLAQSRSLETLAFLTWFPDDDNPDPVTAEAVEALQQQMPWCRCLFDGQTFSRE